MSQAHDFFSKRFGIFARTFARDDMDATLAAVRAHCQVMQWNLSCAGLPTLPEQLDVGQIAAMTEAFEKRQLKVAAVSGTFNMIDPDAARRAENLRRLDLLASQCRWLGTDTITLCTGTRDTDNMWRRHPDNDSQAAWDDLVESMREAVRSAEHHEVTLAFEPEINNVVNSAAKARKLLDEIGSPCLKVVLDVANLIGPGDLLRMVPIIDEAFDLLGRDVAILHAKEIAADGSTGDIAPGRGALDFAHIFRRYVAAGLDVPIILHGLPEEEVAEAKAKLWKEFSMAAMTRWFDHDGLRFRYLDSGDGLPFVFQHGLSGDVTKIQELFECPPNGARLISFDARYHGETRPFQHPQKISFRQFADDLRALLDHLGIEKAVIGGLSMGAGIALNFAIRYPERTLGLILSRPAWLDAPLPENVQMFPVLADLVRCLGPKEAQAAFRNTTIYADVLAQSTDSAAAMLGMFESPIVEETIERFERIPRDCPAPDRDDWRSIRVPTLILANHQDPIHPYAIGPGLSSLIPGSDLRILTPKCESIAQHNSDFTRHISEYFQRHFPAR